MEKQNVEMFLTFFSCINFKYFNSDICNYMGAAWKDRKRYKSNIDFFFSLLRYHLHCLQSRAANKGKNVCALFHTFLQIPHFQFSPAGSTADVQNLERIDTFQIRESRMVEGEIYFQMWIVSPSANSHIFVKMFTYNTYTAFGRRSVYVFMSKASRSSQ